MHRILLVRHGQSLSNRDKNVHKVMPDHAIPLSSEGREQAREAGKIIHDFFEKIEKSVDPPRVVRMNHVRLWTSPYKRCRETAEGIVEASGGVITDVREHILLCEQQFGLFDGIPDEELSKLYPEEHAHYNKCEKYEGRFWARMPLGESRFDVAARVHQMFGTLHRDADKHSIENVVVVCHGVTMRAFVMMWLHLTPEWFEREKNPGNCAVRFLDCTQRPGEKDQGYIFQGFRSDGTRRDDPCDHPDI